jgi:hypothetical protein
MWIKLYKSMQTNIFKRVTVTSFEFTGLLSIMAIRYAYGHALDRAGDGWTQWYHINSVDFRVVLHSLATNSIVVEQILTKIYLPYTNHSVLHVTSAFWGNTSTRYVHVIILFKTTQNLLPNAVHMPVKVLRNLIIKYVTSVQLIIIFPLWAYKLVV